MPKRRSLTATSPPTCPKKSRKPSAALASKEKEKDGSLSPLESADNIVVETALASSDDDEPVMDQVSDDEMIDNDHVSREKNGVSEELQKSNLLLSGVDWVGCQTAKLEIFEKFQQLYEPRSSKDFKEIIESCRELIRKHISSGEQSDRRQLMDQAVREYLLEKLLNTPNAWIRFLELNVALCREDLCSPNSVLALLTDLVELASLNDCSIVFDFVESHLNIWKDPLFYTSGKNAVLRLCNDLLRRQSRAQNTVFCGRILIFLANYFPFSERSGLNIMSEFHAENLTKYKTGDGSDDPDDRIETAEDCDDKLFEGMDLAIPGLDKIVSLTQEEKKKKIKVDYNLYIKFWSLQDYFRNPQECYNKIAWKTFTMYIQDVLGAFQSFKLDDSSHRKKKEFTDEELPSINPIPKLGDENLYFAKYLTNRRLLELQMSDPTFRRYFLVQTVVILQYLNIPTKFKTDAHVLSDDQTDFVKKITDRVYELLAEIPPHGPEFVKCIKHILKREELWNKWKNDGCQAFKKPVPPSSVVSSTNSSEEGASDKAGKKLSEDSPVLSDDVKVRTRKKFRRRIGDSIKEATEKNKVLLGHPELTRLWNICPDNLEACRMKSRDFMPQIDAFFAEAFKEMETEPTPVSVLIDATKKEFKPKKVLGDAIFGWKALRLLARRSPYFFQMFGGAPISPLQNYLEYVLKKINAEREQPQNSQDDPQSGNRKTNHEAKLKDSDSQTNHDSENTADGEQVMEASPAEDDEILRSEDNKDTIESGDEEEGEVNDKLVRRLTDEEIQLLCKGLGEHWKKLAPKLGFKLDEIEFFAEEHKEEAAVHMLTNWQDQDEDANAADLKYLLQGLKFNQLVADVFKG